ncbi:MAG TPA: hypothetical protein VF370_00355 [Candidatus Cryosericum sp.]
MNKHYKPGRFQRTGPKAFRKSVSNYAFGLQHGVFASVVQHRYLQHDHTNTASEVPLRTDWIPRQDKLLYGDTHADTQTPPALVVAESAFIAILTMA